VSIYGFPEYDVRNFGKVRSFTDIFSDTYQRVSLFDKPIIIAELGVTAVIAINATGSNARSEAFVGTQSYKWRCTITVKIVRLRAGKIIQYRTGEFYTPFSSDHLVGPWARANENPKKANKQFGISRLIQHDAGFVADGDFSAAFESRSSTGNRAFRRQDNVSVDVYESATTQRQARL